MKLQLGFGSFVLLVVLILLLLASVWYAAQGLLLPGDPMPTQGYAAMFGGVFLSFVIGSSLMALLFFSSRSGYDAVPRVETQDALQRTKRVGQIEPLSRDEES